MNEPTQAIFELVLARPVDRQHGDDARLVHLAWVAPQQNDRLVQVYVNDALYDLTLWPEARSMWLMLDRRRAHRIELLAVSPSDERGVWAPRPEHLQGWSPAVSDVASIALLRDQTLPVEARLRVAVDGAVVDQGALWPSDTPRAGFGAVFGEGGFGIDAATGPGLGRGELGRGPLGSDSSAWRWRHPDLAAEAHQIDVTAVDDHEQTVTSAFSQSVAVERLPAPADALSTDDDFTLQWQAE